LGEAAAQYLDEGSVVVHGHGFYVWPNAVIGRMARKRGVPLVYHPHGMLEPWILARSRGKKRVAHWLFENANFRAARLWRALTSREADQVRAHGIRVPVVVIPNGIDPEPFWRIRRPNRPVRQALFLGRLHPKKGLDLLVAAWAKLGLETRGWELTIAGPDENGHREELEALVRLAKLEGAVRFVGPVSGAAKIAQLAAAELFVLPSYSEGFPMALLEAMASSVPVLATEESNVPDIAACGAGWLCRANVGSLTNALRDALQAGDEERAQRGCLGRQLVAEKYSWSRLAGELELACAKLIG
jgi:poly(glycerol-phosphate) alpha-glucosyltransferase